MIIDPVVRVLQRRIGLDPASLGEGVLLKAVEGRLAVNHMADPFLYAELLKEKTEEFDALVDRLVVPETWFFRGGLFEELARIIAQATASWSEERVFRILSIPSSTGEEPYSLAIALIEMGLAASRYAIEAVDISPRHVQSARRGVYREFSFRQTDPSVRSRYFHRLDSEWELNQRVRERVHFRVGNLMDPTTLPVECAPFDLVICRNLLIYFTLPARQEAIAHLEHLMAPEGLLALGHAEPGIIEGRAFSRVGSESLFLFRHGASEAPRASWPPLAPPTWNSTPPRSIKPTVAVTPKPVPAKLPDHAISETSRTNPLEAITRLADAGQLDQAFAECQKLLKSATPSADVYNLLGVIEQARSQFQAAADAFRKALYLQPDHRESLSNAMLLASQQGDRKQADILRDRLNRLKLGGEA